MDITTQMKFMYLFERVGEPLYFGPRGSSNFYYELPMGGSNMDTKLLDAVIAVRKAGPPMLQSFKVNQPREMPDLTPIGKLCPKNGLFSYFLPNHLEAATRLKNIFLKQSSLDDLLGMSSFCRNDPMVNHNLWVFAASSCLLERKDMRGFKLPAFVEICPDMFITPAVSRIAQQQSVLPAKDRKKIEISLPPTGNDSNPENAVAYFREDIGLNSHHYHWHLIYTTNQLPGKRDRKGELFYFMHSQMLRRYNTERLGNNLPLALPFNLDETLVDQGYFPKLYNTNAGVVWGTRQTNSKLQDIDRTDDAGTVRLEDLRTWRDRILSAIDLGQVLGPNNEMLPLTVDMLGDIVESSTLSPNQKLYGHLHNLGHVVLAHIHDPMQLHREAMGVLGAPEVAMRDPVFYRWHAFIDDIFEKYKNKLGPYKTEELVWNAVKVSSISVKSIGPGGGESNVLYTNWLMSDIDLGRGLDFGRRGVTNIGPVWASFTHLNHLPFVYNISVTNNSSEPVIATVRIFLAPKNNERNRPLDLKHKRKLFFEMDKFAHTLNPGRNDIVRQSNDSSVTIPFEQGFKQLEKLSQLVKENPEEEEAACGCGWPSHLLLPKSSPQGLTYQFYVIVTNGAEDQIKRKATRTGLPERLCKESISFCGILNELYPDKKAMGYPWDRPIPVDGNNQSLSLNAFVKQVPNSGYVEVRIIHRNEKETRPGGAPIDMETIPDGSQSRPSSPILGGRDLSPPPIRLPSYPPIPSSPTWGSRPKSPPPGRRPKFGSYKPDGLKFGGRFSFNFPDTGRLGRETSPDEEEEGWTHV